MEDKILGVEVSVGEDSGTSILRRRQRACSLGIDGRRHVFQYKAVLC